MSVQPLARMSVGVIVERRKAQNPWIDFTWRAVGVLPGRPAAEPWTVITEDENATTFYAGSATLGLYQSDASNYGDNLNSGQPKVWVRLRQTGREPPYDVFAVTADPTEGESFTEAGDDLVEAVSMPEPVRALLEDFVAKHRVERPFYKRKRDRTDPEALSRGAPHGQDRKHE